MTARKIKKALRALADPVIAQHSLRFFKTGRGQYGEGDKFLGIRVPVIRTHAKTFADTSLEEIQKLLHAPFHEERLCALFMLVQKFSRSGEAEKAHIFQVYLNNTRHINNWDLVDSSAYHIVGAFLEDKDRQPLFALARSASLWERRIAIVATLHFIRQTDFDDTLALARILIDDKEDLIHKAVGWMLREIGKRNSSIAKNFLKKYSKQMPRTMLRYAIEKFSEQERKAYMQGTA